jgi:streptogramin lyase
MQLTQGGMPSPVGVAVPSDLVGSKKVVVLRAYFKDYAAKSRYSKSQVEGFFGQLDTLFKNTSYGKISIAYQVSDLFQFPDNRSAYIDDPPGNISLDAKFTKVLTDAIAKSPSGLDWTNIDAVFVVMAETDSKRWHRGSGGGCNLPMGPGGKNKPVGCAIVSENPNSSDVQVWGRWAHELGHALAQNGFHPSNYNSGFELMDSLYPGQIGVFQKQTDRDFSSWLPASKYLSFTPSGSVGGGVGVGGGIAFIWAMEYDPAGKPNAQAVKAYITDSLYYLISVRRRVLGDELSGIPDEGVLIERVVSGGNVKLNDCADPKKPSQVCARWVEVKGRGGDRNKLWKEGDTYNDTSDGIYINVAKKIDDDDYEVIVRYVDAANQPDVGLFPWTSPPGNTWETTDIWVDSPVNGYGTYRYGMWKDVTGNLVPRGNGDDPAIGQINRLYARVHNFGGKVATDVVVHFDITDPPGKGINGASGWKTLGTVTKADFPALAAIDPGKFTDVYIEWKPDFPLTPEDIAAGRFYFHTCIRVRLDHVSGETVFGNQDGERERENIDYFQVAPSSAAPVKYSDMIHLHNDDLASSKFVYLSYLSDLPDGWMLDINGGVLGVDLNPGEVRDIHITIQPTGALTVGSVFGVDVSASILQMLVNDMDPSDQHPEFQSLGGVRVEARVMLPTRLSCVAERQSVPGTVPSAQQIFVRGQLEGFDGFYDPTNPLRVMIEGVDVTRQFLTATLRVVDVAADGSFSGYLTPIDNLDQVKEVVCLFAGTTELTSAGSGYVPITAVTPAPEVAVNIVSLCEGCTPIPLPISGAEINVISPPLGLQVTPFSFSTNVGNRLTLQAAPTATVSGQSLQFKDWLSLTDNSVLTTSQTLDSTVDKVEMLAAVYQVPPAQQPPVPQLSLYVSSFGSNDVKRFDGTAGAPVGTFASGGGLGSPVGLAFGPDGNLYVSSPASNSVLRFNGTTGAFIDTFASGGNLSNPQGLVFGPDGNLYVSSFNSHSIVRFNGASGTYMDTFASLPAGITVVLCGPEGLVFGPDGNLYVSCSVTNSVLRFNGATGAFIDVFADGGNSGLMNPQGLVFGPDGNLYVSSFNTNEVKRYNGTTGQFMDNFVSADSGGLAAPNGLVFGPDGNLYVSSFASNEVKRFNGTTGAFMDSFVSAGSGGLVQPTSLAFR